MKEVYTTNNNDKNPVRVSCTSIKWKAEKTAPIAAQSKSRSNPNGALPVNLHVYFFSFLNHLVN